MNNLAYDAGRKAFFDLLDLDENPYSYSDTEVDSDEEVSFFDWKKGWKDAAEESNRWDYSLNNLTPKKLMVLFVV